MRDATELYISVPIWKALISIHVTDVLDSNIFCSNFLACLSISVDEV